MELGRNYDAIENTFNTADRNSLSCKRRAKAPGPRRFAVTTAYNARTSLPLGEKCICREKGAAIFSGCGLCTKCYSFPAVGSTQPLSPRPEKGGDKFTVRRKTLSEMYQPLFHDERPRVEISIYARRSRNLRWPRRFKMDRHFFLSRVGRGEATFFVKPWMILYTYTYISSYGTSLEPSQ